MSPAVHSRLAWHVIRAALMVAVLKSARPFIWLAERTHGQLFLDIAKGIQALSRWIDPGPWREPMPR
jgi:hypothetical protein